MTTSTRIILTEVRDFLDAALSGDRRGCKNILVGLKEKTADFTEMDGINICHDVDRFLDLLVEVEADRNGNTEELEMAKAMLAAAVNLSLKQLTKGGE